MLFWTARILRAREGACECADMSAQDGPGGIWGAGDGGGDGADLRALVARGPEEHELQRPCVSAFTHPPC